jgi:hypothetical protein
MKFFKSYITQIKAMSVTIYQCTDASRYFLLRLTNLLNKPFWKYVKSKRTDNVGASGIKKNINTTKGPYPTSKKGECNISPKPVTRASNLIRFTEHKQIQTAFSLISDCDYTINL